METPTPEKWRRAVPSSTTVVERILGYSLAAIMGSYPGRQWLWYSPSGPAGGLSAGWQCLCTAFAYGAQPHCPSRAYARETWGVEGVVELAGGRSDPFAETTEIRMHRFIRLPAVGLLERVCRFLSHLN